MKKKLFLLSIAMLMAGSVQAKNFRAKFMKDKDGLGYIGVVARYHWCGFFTMKPKTETGLIQVKAMEYDGDGFPVQITSQGTVGTPGAAGGWVQIQNPIKARYDGAGMSSGSHYRLYCKYNGKNADCKKYIDIESPKSLHNVGCLGSLTTRSKEYYPFWMNQAYQWAGKRAAPEHLPRGFQK